MDSVEGQAQSVDTDGDGTPDYLDLDSDGDSLTDALESQNNAAGCHEPIDSDGDTTPDFRDSDSDDDGLDDLCEAGPGHELDEPAPDTDGDGTYDSVDLDADGDGLRDDEEDANLDCVLDAGETSATDSDSDDDATSDLIEVVLESNARDPLETPSTLGKPYFIVDYQVAAVPAETVVPIRTNLQQVDVALIVDTTATSGGEIQNLKTGVATLVQTLQSTTPSLAVGVAGFDDFPTGNYGALGIDQPFYVAGSTGFVSTTLSDTVTAAMTLNVHDGGDFPESQVAAMFRALTNQFLIWDSGQIAPTGQPAGTYGSLRFRTGALPILVAITDGSFHNGRRVSNPAVLHDPYSFNGTPPFPTPTVDALVSEMNAKGARFIGISSADGARAGSDPYMDLAYLTDHVASHVSPAAFGGSLCATGLSGSLLLPDGPATLEDPAGTCRLVFDVATNGDGVSTSIVTGVQALVQSIDVDVRPIATPGPGPVDAVDSFIESIAVEPTGGNDAAEPGSPCINVAQIADLWSGPQGLVNTPDTVSETALSVKTSQKICFKIVPKDNTTIPQVPTAQIFEATLTLRARNGAAPVELLVGSPRVITFIVPPTPL